MFQDYPLKTLGEVVFKRICYICISKFLKKGITLLGKDEYNIHPFTHNYIQWVTILEGFRIIH